MPNGSEPTISPPQPKEVCAIRIAFPVESDEQAIEYKKKIGDVLSDMPNALIEFSIKTIPQRPPMPV